MFVSSIVRSESSNLPAPTDDFWYEPINNQSSSGVRVSVNSALRASAVFACVTVLAETIGSIPRAIFERKEDGSKRRASEHYLNPIVSFSPHPEFTAMEYYEMQTGFAALYGDCFAEIIPDPRNLVGHLLPIRPDRVKIFENENGTRIYEISNPHDGSKRRITGDRMHHVRGFSVDGVNGLSRIGLGLDAVGLALVTEQFAGRYFSQDATPVGALKTAASLSDEARGNLKKSWREAHSGIKNAHSIAILEEGLEFQQFSMANRDSQFLEIRRHQIAEIARFFRIPLHMINELEKSSFNNIEQQSIEFVKYTIRPWLTRIEQRVAMDLIDDPNRFYLKHNLDALLRGETKSRYEAYGVAITNGFMTRNEVREKEDLDKIEGLDKPLQQMNMEVSGSNSENLKDMATASKDIIADAVSRVVSSELDNVDKINKKHKENPAELFTALDKYYKGPLRKYIEKTFSPLSGLISINYDNKKFSSSDLSIKYTENAINEIKGLEESPTFSSNSVMQKINQIYQLITNVRENHVWSN